MPGDNGDSVKAEVSDSAISPNLESSVQDALDDTFGGVDQDSLEREVGNDNSRRERTRSKDAGDDTDEPRRVKVREHERVVRKRRSEDDEDRGFGEEAEDRDRQATGEEQDDKGQQRGQSREASREAEEPDREDEEVEHDIPAHLIESARRRGWSQERIDRLVAADPEVARETFEQLHTDANELSRRYADLGRLAAGQGIQGQQGVQGQPPAQPQSYWQQPAYGGLPQQQNGQQQQTQPPAQVQGLPDRFAFDQTVLQGLDESFVKGVVTPLENLVNQALLPQIRQATTYIQEQQRESLYMTIDGFFNGLKGFEKQYGIDKQRTDLAQGEMEARLRVIQEADAIRTGAQLQGRPLTVQEALEMAHNLVSSEHHRETARREVRGQLQRRQGQATLRPTHRSGGPGEVRSKDPLAKATQKAAAKLREINRS